MAEDDASFSLGEWSFRKRADGRWEGRTHLGDKRYKSVYAKTNEECVRRAMRLSDRLLIGDGKDAADTTVDAFLDRWFALKRQSLRPSSVFNYDRAIKKILPYIGSLSLADLTATHINIAYEHFLAKPGILWQIDTMLRSACNDAVRSGALRISPLALLKKPEQRRKEYRVLSAEEIRLVLDAARRIAPDYFALFVLALTTGARQGELLALGWPSVDFKRRTIFIAASAVTIEGEKPFTGPPKTRSSRRTLDLAPIAVTALEEHYALQCKRGLQNYQVFCTSAGTVMRRCNMTTLWHRVRKAAGLGASGVRFHDMRHTVATHLLQAGVPVKKVSDLLGHASSRITEETYAHVLPGAGRDLAAQMESIVLGLSGSIGKDGSK